MAWNRWDSSLLRVGAFAGLLAPLVAGIATLVKRIVFPTIVAFPWDDDHRADAVDSTSRQPSASNTTLSPWRRLLRTRQEEDREKVVVLAGSFNPIHKGHVSMLEYLARRYGRVIVAIGMNPDKKYAVTPHQRAELIQRVMESELTASLRSKIQVQVISGYIWRTVQRQNASILFRGIRTWDVDGPDERKLQILNTWGPLVLGPLWWPLPTVFLQGDPRYAHVSSTLIRTVCGGPRNFDGAQQLVESTLQSLVPSCIVQDVMKLYGSEHSKCNDR